MKLLGICLLLGVTLAASVCVVAHEKKRRCQTEALCRLFEHVYEKSVFEKMPLFDIYRCFSNACLEKTGMLKELRTKHGDEPYSNLFCKCFDNAKGNFALSAEQWNLFYEFGGLLGTVAYDGGERLLQYIGRVKKEDEHVRAEYKNRVKMGVALCLSIGLGIVILIV